MKLCHLLSMFGVDRRCDIQSIMDEVFGSLTISSSRSRKRKTGCVIGRKLGDGTDKLNWLSAIQAAAQGRYAYPIDLDLKIAGIYDGPNPTATSA